MEKDEEKQIIIQLIFEIVERIARFITHLDEIRNEFYNDEDSIVRDKLVFINSYEDCLVKYFQIALVYLNVLEKNDNCNNRLIFSKLELVLKSINDLHTCHLIHLPRPDEPIELRRFGRVIQKQIFNIGSDTINENNPISLYITEQIGEVSYATDPLQNFKLDQINTLIFDYNFSYSQLYTVTEFQDKKPDNGPSSFHITISRIDASNPCHWPTLLHEVSHNLMKQELFVENDIYNDFKAYLKSKEAEDCFEQIEKELSINTKAWLTECWCDLFACASIGPSFYFAQYHSFLNYFDYGMNDKYPPFLFRLKLIEKILYHRFKSILKEEHFDKEIALTQNIILALEKNQRLKYSENGNVRKLFSLFKEYFLDHLFKPGIEKGVTLTNVQLNTDFQKTVRYVNEISSERIEILTNNLSKGFPIPSYIESKEPVYIEKPTSVQEILFAAWNYRNTYFKDKILTELKLILLNFDLKKEEELKSYLKNNICKTLLRFDHSLLRSIQVSEYFDALMDPEENCHNQALEIPDPVITEKCSNLGQLVDWEILKCIKDENINIIPIISLKHQQGSTSLDIRLGSTFELYLPNQFGIVDFAEKESINKISKSAQKNNLDFLNSIAINPGQFILGHSMEYIKLSDIISAELEGRSSFARLGIEIHMTAGFIDPGFEGVLTFEIFNAGPSPVKLYPGMRIGQLRFTKTNRPSKSYNKRNTAKYAGLLEYHSSKQNKDFEVAMIRGLISTKNKAK